MTLRFKLTTFFSLLVIFLLLTYSHYGQSKEPPFLEKTSSPLSNIISDVLTNLRHDLVYGVLLSNERVTAQNEIIPSFPTFLSSRPPPLSTAEKNQETPPPTQTFPDDERDDPYYLYDATLNEDYLYDVDDDDEFRQYGMNQYDIFIHAPITHINATQNTLEVSPVTGQPPITIHLDSNTQIQNKPMFTSQLHLSDIIINNFVEITAFENHEGLLIATNITLSNDNITQVQGTLQNDAMPFSIKVLDIEFMIDENTQLDSFFLITQEDSEPPKSADYPANTQFINALLQYYSHDSQDHIKASITSQFNHPNVAQTITIQ